MGNVGILHEDERVELIHGDLIQMAAVGGRHIGTVIRLGEWFTPRLLGRAHVSIQSPIHVPPCSEPEPDVGILRWRGELYSGSTPTSDDVLLVIEVADTTLRYDRDVKIPLYAAAGIPDAWLVDLPRRRILVYREPVNGAYRQVTIVREGTLTPLAFPDLSIRLDEIIGR